MSLNLGASEPKLGSDPGVLLSLNREYIYIYIYIYTRPLIKVGSNPCTPSSLAQVLRKSLKYDKEYANVCPNNIFRAGA